jgi:hypothetical protein
VLHLLNVAELDTLPYRLASFSTNNHVSFASSGIPFNAVASQNPLQDGKLECAIHFAPVQTAANSLVSTRPMASVNRCADFLELYSNVPHATSRPSIYILK